MFPILVSSRCSSSSPASCTSAGPLSDCWCHSHGSAKRSARSRCGSARACSSAAAVASSSRQQVPISSIGQSPRTTGWSTGLDGVLRIRLPNPSSGGDHLLRIVRRFREQNPACEVTLVTGGIRDDPLRQLRAGEVDLAALRLPLHQSDLTIGPVLSEESRVLLVAEDDPLAEREHIDYDDVGERRVSQNPAFPAEMMDAFIPPVTASGRTLNRVQNESIEQLMLRVALGEQVHPTVVSWLDHHPYAGVVAVPIRDLPVTQTALVWLRNSFDARVRAFVDVTENVLGAFPLG